MKSNLCCEEYNILNDDISKNEWDPRRLEYEQLLCWYTSSGLHKYIIYFTDFNFGKSVTIIDWI